MASIDDPATAAGAERSSARDVARLDPHEAGPVGDRELECEPCPAAHRIERHAEVHPIDALAAGRDGAEERDSGGGAQSGRGDRKASQRGRSSMGGGGGNKPRKPRH